MRAIVISLAVCCALSAGASAQLRPGDAASDDGRWYTLNVPGGRQALESLGVPSTMPRALILSSLVRRLHLQDDGGDLAMAVAEYAAAAADLTRLQDAIAAASTRGRPPVLTSVQPSRVSRELRAAFEAAGLRLRTAGQQLVVEDDRGGRAVQLRARLKTLGVDTEDLRRRVAAGESLSITVPSIDLPLPLAPQTWSRSVFERNVTPATLFVEIVTSPRARLLYDGLMSLDGDTRRWLGSNNDVLRQIYGDPDALRAFSLFAPALRIRNNTVVVPGGALAARRWTAVLDAEASRADRFVTRLLARENGRLAGLYFTLASADEMRRSFILGGAAAGDENFTRLASDFVECYANELPAYPYSIRFSDPALLLLEIELDGRGMLAGPASQRFWNRALNGDSLPDDPTGDLSDRSREGDVDAHELVRLLCDVSPAERAAVFEALLFAHRVFPDAPDTEVADVLVAVMTRRLYPALASALEQAGMTAPSTYARLAVRAEQISRVGDAVSVISALQQFQGAVALTLGVVRAQTLSADAGSRLLESLADVPLEDGRYGGRLAAWFESRWLTDVSRARAAEASSDSDVEGRIIEAMAGPTAAVAPFEWEGLKHVVDLAGDARRRLREARTRQGGPPIDRAISLVRLIAALRSPLLTVERVGQLRAELGALRDDVEGFRAAEEFLEDGPDVRRTLDGALRDLAGITEPREVSRARASADDMVPVLDFVFGQMLASWAYTPQLAQLAPQLAASGDPSLRHQFGIRIMGPARATQRWQIAWRGDLNDGVSGALFGLEAALAQQMLRRLSSNGLPDEPVLDRNDIAAMQLTAAFSDPRRLTDSARDRISDAIAAGAMTVARAARDGEALAAAAEAAALGPWRTQALLWTAEETTDPIDGWFTSPELAWVGGLRPEDVDVWGMSFLPAGCLCLRMPRLRPPEALLGRTVAGIRPYSSPGLMVRIAAMLGQHRLPAALAPTIQRYAMRDLIDRVRPAHSADLAAFAQEIERIDRARFEDYISAAAATGPVAETPLQPR